MKSTLKIRTRFYTNPALPAGRRGCHACGRQEFLIKDSMPACRSDGITARRHVAAENQFNTHETKKYILNPIVLLYVTISFSF